MSHLVRASPPSPFKDLQRWWVWLISYPFPQSIIQIHLLKQPKEIRDIKQFIKITQRKDASRALNLTTTICLSNITILFVLL